MSSRIIISLILFALCHYRAKVNKPRIWRFAMFSLLLPFFYPRDRLCLLPSFLSHILFIFYFSSVYFLSLFLLFLTVGRSNLLRYVIYVSVSEINMTSFLAPNSIYFKISRPRLTCRLHFPRYHQRCPQMMGFALFSCLRHGWNAARRDLAHL